MISRIVSLFFIAACLATVGASGGACLACIERGLDFTAIACLFAGLTIASGFFSLADAIDKL